LTRDLRPHHVGLLPQLAPSSKQWLLCHFHHKSTASLYALSLHDALPICLASSHASVSREKRFALVSRERRKKVLHHMPRLVACNIESGNIGTPVTDRAQIQCSA